MNLQRLKSLEKEFLKKYPDAFEDPHFIPILKRHNIGKLTAFAQETFAALRFKNPAVIVTDLEKLISRSSMVSLFEKPKFRDFVRNLSGPAIRKLAAGLGDFLHGEKQEQGFNAMLEVLKSGKLAKWSLITAPGSYFRPQIEVFIKPTTAKGIIAMLELNKLEYRPQPSWVFYQTYRREINAMKKKVSKSLSPNNAAFSGFLMMGLTP